MPRSPRSCSKKGTGLWRLALVLAGGTTLAACSHPARLSSGPYDSPTTSVAGTTTIPPTATSAPRTGWVPVVFHGAKVAVPPSWEAVRLESSPCHPAHQPGTIWVGKTARHCAVWSSKPGRTANLVIFGPRRAVPLGAVVGHQRVHGYPADIYSLGPERLYGQSFLRGTAAYYFPSLGVTVAFSGPLGLEVLETIHSAS